MDDYFEVGAMIVSRLSEQITDVSVYHLWRQHEINEATDPIPSLKVELEADVPGDVANNGKTHKVEQRWVVILVAKDDTVGPLVSRVIRALSGWRPPGTLAPLKRVASSHTPDWSPAGVFYFPVAFSTGFVFTVE
ncbi:MAG: hypothetical protein HQM00_05720 [Magnetococcales bacterium]|nr:hypothetical protein [Magnetococcales bacterium]